MEEHLTLLKENEYKYIATLFREGGSNPVLSTFLAKSCGQVDLVRLSKGVGKFMIGLYFSSKISTSIMSHSDKCYNTTVSTSP